MKGLKAKIVQSENISLSQHQFMSNVMRCINQRFAFKNSGISCLALMQQSENDNPACKKEVPALPIETN